jgi:fructuronate reductase
LRGDNIVKWGKIDDPRAEELAAIWTQNSPQTIAAALFGPNGAMASDWQPSEDDLKLIRI